MGVKAEQRFYKLNREHFDREARRNPESRGTEILSTQGRIQDLEEALKAEREKNKRAMACIGRLRCYLSDARRQTAEARADAKFQHELMMGWLRTSEKNKRAWIYVSRMLRDLCTPEQIDRWREENRENEA